MKDNKVRVKKVVEAKTGRVYSVNVARMDQYLAETREAFKERVKLTHQTRGEFAGVLAGTVSKSRTTK
ncbi:hypothetical protein Jab_2c26970 [Janthinobacterium sp. HH01]|uniref:hypothetical protein n=1 Tax=Janthinobacterium sp. HH01 TaxID=1198452 RepID=UPI0002AE8FF5|nr:hypothetical protein [Janthinobacterium sp. HH01]ELX10599.1 hypothetical protein Jab_2c26970 [Janthinobacterium sp. HH01]